MKCFSILLLLFCVSTVSAEHKENKDPLNGYGMSGPSTDQRILEFAKKLNDPTIMSGNFRQALQNINPGIIPTASASTGDIDEEEESDMPFIELVAKVLAADKPSSVVLRVNDHSIHLTEGSVASQMVNRKIVNIRVDKITENDVTIFLSPFEQVMVLQ